MMKEEKDTMNKLVDFAIKWWWALLIIGIFFIFLSCVNPWFTLLSLGFSGFWLSLFAGVQLGNMY